MIALVAKCFVLPGKEDEFKSLAAPLIEASNLEEGCLSYGLFRAKDGSCLAFVEHWKDAAALEAHNNTPHFTSIVPRFAALVSKPGEVEFYEEF